MSQAPPSSNAQDPAQAAAMEHPGRAQLLQLHPIPSMEPSQKHSGTPASLQQPRHRTNASQGFVITTPHG